MFKPPRTILFATNMSESCLPALLFATSLASKYQSKLILFHVIEPMATSLDERLKWMLGDRYKRIFGKSEYNEIKERRMNDARSHLIGKKSNPNLIRSALDQFGEHSGMDRESTGWDPSSIEIDVSKGDVVDEIVKKAMEAKSDLIIMGARGGFLTDSTIGNTIRSVIQRAKVSVLVVPPDNTTA